MGGRLLKFPFFFKLLFGCWQRLVGSCLHLTYGPIKRGKEIFFPLNKKNYKILTHIIGKVAPNIFIYSFTIIKKWWKKNKRTKLVIGIFFSLKSLPLWTKWFEILLQREKIFLQKKISSVMFYKNTFCFGCSNKKKQLKAAEKMWLKVKKNETKNELVNLYVKQTYSGFYSWFLPSCTESWKNWLLKIYSNIIHEWMQSEWVRNMARGWEENNLTFDFRLW